MNAHGLGTTLALTFYPTLFHLSFLSPTQRADLKAVFTAGSWVGSVGEESATNHFLIGERRPTTFTRVGLYCFASQ